MLTVLRLELSRDIKIFRDLDILSDLSHLYALTPSVTLL